MFEDRRCGNWDEGTIGWKCGRVADIEDIRFGFSLTELFSVELATDTFCCLALSFRRIWMVPYGQHD